MSGPVGSCESLGSAELKNWFPDPMEKATVMLKWIKATRELEKIQDRLPQARGIWLEGCSVMREIK